MSSIHSKISDHVLKQSLEDGQKKRLSWLFVTSEFPWPLAHGTWLRVFHFVKTLREKGDRVALLTYSDSAGEGVSAYEELGVELFLLESQNSNASSFDTGLFSSPYRYEPTMARMISDLSQDVDGVVLERSAMLRYSSSVQKGRKIICDVIDDPILEKKRKFFRDFNVVRMLRDIEEMISEIRYERRYCEWADNFIFVTQEDADHFRRRLPSVNVKVIPEGVDVSYFAKPEQVQNRPTSIRSEIPTVLFSGNLCHPPNEDAAWFIANKVMPLVVKKNPKVQFVIVGPNAPERLKRVNHPQLTLTGWVEDIRPWLWSSTAALIPMRMGTGIKNKLLEAWAAGVPVVTTKLGCQGIGRDGTEAVLVGNSADELAEHLISVLADDGLKNYMIESGKKIAERRFRWSDVVEGLRDVCRVESYTARG
jgi:glycosyltransferase involved in cell wall biosynthesis